MAATKEEIEEHYFKTPEDWRAWLEANHDLSKGVYIIMYKIGHEKKSMRWEEAVQQALCYGWIDSTVKSLGDGKRRQYFCPRKPKSAWSKLNKTYIKELMEKGMMHESGLKKINNAKADGSWTALDDVENGVIPEDLQKEFNSNPKAYSNYNDFSWTHRKSYLYWLNQAKKSETRQNRIREIIKNCEANIKSRT